MRLFRVELNVQVKSIREESHLQISVVYFAKVFGIEIFKKWWPEFDSMTKKRNNFDKVDRI